MGAHDMHKRNLDSDGDAILAGGIYIGEVGTSQRRCEGISGRNKGAAMRASLYFHRIVIVCAVIVAFFNGAIAHGREELLRHEAISLLALMTVNQLTEIRI